MSNERGARSRKSGLDSRLEGRAKRRRSIADMMRVLLAPLHSAYHLFAHLWLHMPRWIIYKHLHTKNLTRSRRKGDFTLVCSTAQTLSPLYFSFSLFAVFYKRHLSSFKAAHGKKQISKALIKDSQLLIYAGGRVQYRDYERRRANPNLVFAVRRYPIQYRYGSLRNEYLTPVVDIIRRSLSVQMLPEII